ncbi:hypothetical protein HYDPIDRAFT_29781 [Hydnomerulius pinastri MD-312]|uniref:Major facilitator superfamily (MFS) profile domain-containing protein n=1 Tax=Hydnomerulius pinastri MD-312 TaxID=994086 RepID=A0A0C9W7E2_9AGAM|nr:hypothetical protein HYDPIDRAFT_29781 [Hydnomerulius pinastri MD-312]
MANIAQTPRSESLTPNGASCGPTSEPTTLCDKEKALVDVPEVPIHEGDLLGLSTALGAFLVQLCSYGYTIAFGVYQDYYTQNYLSSYNSSAISWIGSTNAFLFEILGFVSGRLYDRGYFYHLMVGGSALQAVSLFMLSLAKPGQYYQIFLSQGVASGIASGLLFVPSLAVLSHHFDDHVAMAMTFVASGTCLGGVVHPIMLNNTINGKLGFANGVRASAGLVSGLLLIACLLVRTRMRPSSDHVKFLVAAKKCLHDSAYLFGVSGLTAFIIWFYYPLFYLQLDAVTHGLDRTFSFYSVESCFESLPWVSTHLLSHVKLVIMNASSFVSQIITGLVANRFGVDNMIIVSSFGATVLLFGLIGVRTVASVVAIGVIYGFFAGAFLALWGPVLTLLTPDLSELGVRLGIACVVMALGGLIGPPISGALLTDRYIWYRGAIFNGAVAAFGTIMLVVMKVMLDRRRRDSKALSDPGHCAF